MVNKKSTKNSSTDQVPGNSNRTSRRTRTTSQKALQNLAQDAGAKTTKKTTTKSGQKRKNPNQKAPSKRRRVPDTAEDTTISADNVRASGEQNVQISASDVQAMVTEAMNKMVPEIVNRALQQGNSAAQRSPDSAIEGSDSDEDEEESNDDEEDDDDGDEVEFVKEQELRKRALASRRAATSVARVARVHPSPVQQILPADLLPAVDAKVIKKIKKGEFVDLSLCLPTLSPHNKVPIMTPTINSDGDPAWKVDSSVPRGKIRNFSDWVLAWNNYVRCVSYFYPELTRQLLYHQSDVTSLCRHNTFASVMLYEQAYRTRIANKEVMRWDYHDNEIRSACLVALSRTPHSTTHQSSASFDKEGGCWSCGESGHFASTCPTGTQTSTGQTVRESRPPFRAPLRPTGRPATATPRSAVIPPRRNACKFWNTETGCTYQICRFDHRCSICQASVHTALHCPRRHEQS